MALHRRRPLDEDYGHAIGILVLESRFPFIPGDVRNARSFGYPVLYKTVSGLSDADCARGTRELKSIRPSCSFTAARKAPGTTPGAIVGTLRCSPRTVTWCS